jgi:hypothetical protein
MSKEFTEAQQEAIATADAHLSNVGLPTYAELRAALALAHQALFNEEGDGDLHDRAVRAIDAALAE